MRPIYVSTVCPASPRDIWPLLEAYHSLGLQAVELGSCEVGEDDSLASRLADWPFKYLVHGNFPTPADDFYINVASPDPDIAARSMTHVLGAIELAAELGSPLHSMHPGFVGDPIGYDEIRGLVFPPTASAAETRAAEERFTIAVQRAMDRAAELGVRLLVENSDVTPYKVGRALLGTPAELLALVDKVDGVELLIDTGHLSVTATTFDLDPLAAIAELTEVIGGFHAHQNDGTLDTHDPVTEGSWVLEVLRRPYFAQLPITTEARLPSPTDVASHVEWLGKALLGTD